MKSLKTACTTLLLLTSSMLFFSSAQEVENHFDAFTSASKYLSIKGGTITKSSATIEWYEWYENDSDINHYLLLWGKEEGVFTDTLNLRPYENKKVISTVIQPLEESTTYYAQFFREYKETKYITDFYFNTPPLPSGVNDRSIQNNLLFPEKLSEISIFTINGKLVTQVSTFPKDVSGLLSKLTPPGMYLVSYRAGKKIIKSERILIGQ